MDLRQLHDGAQRIRAGVQTAIGSYGFLIGRLLEGDLDFRSDESLSPNARLLPDETRAALATPIPGGN
jgi:hypothetical protein